MVRLGKLRRINALHLTTKPHEAPQRFNAADEAALDARLLMENFMRRPGKNKETIRGRFFTWVVGIRNGIYCADGRGNSIKLGRFSLGSADRGEALSNLELLDRKQAVSAGKADRSILDPVMQPITLAAGRRLFEEHVARPLVTGGARLSTQHRYRSILNVFIPFAESVGVRNWNEVTRKTLERFAAHRGADNIAANTQSMDLRTLKQVVGWLVDEKHLPESCRIELNVPRDRESTAYCWSAAEVHSMIEYCQKTVGLRWMGEILMVLSFTGMRIAELMQLRWSDINFEGREVRLVDETRRRVRGGETPRSLKGKRGRGFPLHVDLIPVLQGIERRNDGYVFHLPSGRCLNYQTLRTIFVAEVIAPLKHNFPAPPGEKSFVDGRFHSFRHFFCSRCANNGIAEPVLMHWLGHRDAAMVRRYYHLHRNESRRHMDRLPILVANGAESGAVDLMTSKETVFPDLDTPEKPTVTTEKVA